MAKARKTGFIAILFLMCTAQVATAQFDGFMSIPITVKEPKVEGPITTIGFDAMSIDFGLIDEGTVVERVFTFSNTGTEPLVLSDVRGSCGCTVPSWPRHPIMPGEKASLTVTFNSANKVGRRNQKVTIEANTDPAQTFLTLQGEVSPKANSSGDAADGQVETVGAVMPEPDKSCVVIYPNPTAEMLTVDMKGHIGDIVQISILSLEGQVMAERNVPDAPDKIEFSVSHYPAGTYFAHVRVGTVQREVKCFVVVK